MWRTREVEFRRSLRNTTRGCLRPVNPRRIDAFRYRFMIWDWKNASRFESQEDFRHLRSYVLMQREGIAASCCDGAALRCGPPPVLERARNIRRVDAVML